jgi:hypothetical protein
MSGTMLELRDEEYEQPSSYALARRAPMELSSPAEIAAAIAERDDDQLLRTMAGEVITEFFYEFKIQNKLVEGISVTGANEFARIRADAGFPIRFPPGSIDIQEVIQNDQRGLRAIATARDCRSGADGIGMCFQPWMVERKVKDKQGRVTGTEWVENNHADRKALSIAKRNAILSLLPEAQILVILRERKKLIAQNERENKGLLAPGPKQTTTALRQDEDPYRAEPAKPKGAAPETRARLIELLNDVRVPDRVRDKVERGLEDGVSEKVAAGWVTAIEVELNPPAAAEARESDDDLFGGAPARKSVNAVEQGR